MIDPADTHPPSFSARQRVGIAASVLLSILSVVALGGMVNYLAGHHAPRLYWGAAADYQLSPFTRHALDSFTNQVRITVFFRKTHPVYPSVRALLREYAAASPRLEVEELDYLSNPAAGQAFRRRFSLSVPDDEPDLVLFEAGGRTKAVAVRDLRDYDTRALMRGESEAPPIAFKGELLFTSAINSVCEGRARKAAFLEGHGEHDFRSDDAQTGYRKLAALLEEDNVELSGLRLANGTDVPTDLELVIVAGTQDHLAAAELQSLDRFLRRGGRLLVLLRQHALTGLEGLLAEWGIRADDSLVLDQENSDNGLLVVSRYGRHPVTRSLARSRLYLILPRAVEARPVNSILGAPAVIQPLLLTGSNGIAATTFTAGGYRLTPDDRRGEIPLAVGVERGALPGVAASLGTTRIVAVGDSSFLANQLVGLAGNRHFASAAVNWLLDRSHLLGGIQPVPIHTYQVTLTPYQQQMLWWLLLVVLPGTALGVGFVVWWRRH